MIFTIDSAHAGERLDVFLAREGDVTRSRAGALIREGAARVNGSVPSKAGYALQEGDEVSFEVPEPAPAHVAAEDIPLPEEIAEEMGISEDKVREIIKIAQEPVSLETPIGEEEDSHLGDFLPDEDAPAPAEAAAFTLLKEQLMSVLSTLTPREEMVLKLRFGLEDGRQRTLEEVGKEFKVTRERIRQIEAKALRKLRHPSRSRKLKDSLD